MYNSHASPASGPSLRHNPRADTCSSNIGNVISFIDTTLTTIAAASDPTTQSDFPLLATQYAAIAAKTPTVGQMSGNVSKLTLVMPSSKATGRIAATIGMV